jgi:radical SAM protein with 4Fe4S-binding SPASM domain
MGPLNRWLKGERIFPVYCAISVTDSCNYSCIFCVYDSLKRKKKFLDMGRSLKIIRELADNGLKGLFFSGEGEPLIHPNIVDFITRSRRAGVECALNTNGFFLTQKMSRQLLKSLTFMRVSINGCNPKNYQKIHMATPEAYGRVIRNLADAVKVRKEEGLTTTIGVQCIILKENIGLIGGLADDLMDAGVDYLSLKPFLPIGTTTYRTAIDMEDGRTVSLLKRWEKKSTDRFRVIVRWGSLAKFKARTYDRCLSLPFMIEIDSKGDVYPCGVLLGNKKFSCGNIYLQEYRQIMESPRYARVMKNIQTKLDVHKCMPNCRNDAVNRFLWSLKYPPEHLNFI